MTGKQRLYDSKYAELAEHFLADEAEFKGMSSEARAKMTKELAEHIQSAIEDWLAS